MVRTKQTARGSSAPQPGGMATARFAGAGRGRGRGDPEEQFADEPLDIADEDLPNVLEDADKPNRGEPSTIKSVGKEGTAQTKGQAAEGAQAPPEGIPPASIPVPIAPQPGTSTGPTKDPTDDQAQDPTQTTGEVEIKLTQYVKDYRAAGKVWLDTVVQEKEKAYDTLYDRLQQLGAPHKEGLDQADKQQVYNCIKDRTGMFLSQDENGRYVETEEELRNAKKIYRNATDQTRTMAAFMYFVLYEQITGLKASQTGCSRDFQCQGTPFKRLVTGKRQPGGPGRSGEQRSKRTLGEVAELEGSKPAKQTRSTRTPKTRMGKGKKNK